MYTLNYLNIRIKNFSLKRIQFTINITRSIVLINFNNLCQFDILISVFTFFIWIKYNHKNEILREIYGFIFLTSSKLDSISYGCFQFNVFYNKEILRFLIHHLRTLHKMFLFYFSIVKIYERILLSFSKFYPTNDYSIPINISRIIFRKDLQQI